MEEDEMDFTPSSNTNSNLASLFGIKKPLKGNSSLTYTAPKAPKRESDPSEIESAEQKTNKTKIICSKAVHVYKLENRRYATLGLNGIVISGSHHSHTFEIILYKPNKEHICQIKISRIFSVTLSANNYVSFYDNNKQNWSIMFQSSKDVEEFCQKLAVCKFYSSPEQLESVLIQDVTPSSNSPVNFQDTVDVIYKSLSLNHYETSKLEEEMKERIKLSTYGFSPLSEGLIGCSENCKRILIIPHKLSGQWKNKLNSNSNLMLEVKVEKIITESENSSFLAKPEYGPDSPLDSSAEEINIKATGISNKEGLISKKSQKASLISRMAKMGQATLPLRQVLSGDPSDSEEDGLQVSSPKPRMPRNRMSANIHQSVSVPQTSQVQNLEGSQQLSVYQNDMNWQHSQKLGLPHQQLVPVSASPVLSPTTDPSLSIYVTESRIQATELRMGISKISEKLDLVLNKVQNVRGNEYEVRSQHPQDTGRILSSIQDLITENGHLKQKVEEQKGKIDQQSDRIFHLLELNHKYLERDTTALEKHSESEQMSNVKMELLLKREAELEGDKEQALERVKNLESELAMSIEANVKLKKKVEEITEEIESLRKNVQINHNLQTELDVQSEKMSKATETILKLQESVRELESKNDNLKSVMKTQKNEIESLRSKLKDSEVKSEEYENTVAGLKKQISIEEENTGAKIQLLSKTVTKLEEENKSLLGKNEKGHNETHVAKILENISLMLSNQAPDAGEYSASSILSAIKKIINEDSPKHETAILESQNSPVAQTATPSLQNVDVAVKENVIPSQEKEEKQSLDDEGDLQKGKDKKEDKIESCDKNSDRFKSYDQGWRTTKPPPPPLFDDEDDDDDWLN